MTDTLKTGVKLHESGDRSGALKTYLSCWQENPSSEAAYLIGLVYYEQNDYPRAREWLLKSRDLNSKNAHLHNLFGELERKSNNLFAAYTAFSEAVSIDSCFHQAYFGLGQVCVLQDNLKEALKFFHKAVFLAPRKDTYWAAFVHTLNALEKSDEAFAILGHAIDHCPESQMLKNLKASLSPLKQTEFGDVLDFDKSKSEFQDLFDAKELDKAEVLIRRIIEQYPEDKTSHYNLAKLLLIKKRYEETLSVIEHIFEIGGYITAVWLLKAQCLAEMSQFEESLNALSRADSVDGRNVKVHFLKGLNFKELERYDEAVISLIAAHELVPDDLPILMNLGNVYLLQRRYAEASSIMKLILTKAPDHVMAHLGLAAGYYHLEIKDDPQHLRHSFELCRRAIELAPEEPYPHLNIGSVLLDMVLIDAALEQMEYGFGKIQGNQASYASTVFHSNYSSSRSAREIAEMHRDWARRFEDPVYVDPSDIDWTLTVDPERKLRVGILSADFRFHPVAYFLMPLLQSVDRGAFEFVAFSGTNESDHDEMTKKLKEQFVQWYDIVDMGNEDIARTSRESKVDILLDISGYTTGQRLLALANRMAPVQVEWLGYPNTTGMRSIDYRITDFITESEGEADEFSTEKLIRLKHGFHVYKPYYKFPDVTQCPWVKEGHITFGSFNNVRKITPEVIALWAKILKKVPNSKLVLKDRNLDYSENRSRVLSLFVLNGISTKRIELIGMMKSNAAHLNAYSKIDIALDPFPYNGTTTTCEALYMGVPVIALFGNRHAARVTSSILTHAGRSEWIAENKDAYLEIAARLASDPHKMVEYRKEQRSLMENSELCDVKRFTRDMEVVFRRVWKDWCAQQNALEERK